MQNVVSLQTDRPRAPRASNVPRSGARILLFTGVRYCRAERIEAEGAIPGEADRGDRRPPAPGRALDATAH